jgi:hypothetical protein
MTVLAAQQQIDNTIAVGGNANGAVAVGAEAGALWLHLARAGFISGSFSGAATPGAGGVYSCQVTAPNNICPDNRFGLGFLIASAAVTFPAPASHHLYTGSNIPVDIAAELDRKIDDGNPDNGSVLGGRTAGAQATCVAGGVYNITGASADCGLALNNL